MRAALRHRHHIDQRGDRAHGQPIHRRARLLHQVDLARIGADRHRHAPGGKRLGRRAAAHHDHRVVGAQFRDPVEHRLLAPFRHQHGQRQAARFQQHLALPFRREQIIPALDLAGLHHVGVDAERDFQVPAGNRPPVVHHVIRVGGEIAHPVHLRRQVPVQHLLHVQQGHVERVDIHLPGLALGQDALQGRGRLDAEMRDLDAREGGVEARDHGAHQRDFLRPPIDQLAFLARRGGHRIPVRRLRATPEGGGAGDGGGTCQHSPARREYHVLFLLHVRPPSTGALRQPAGVAPRLYCLGACLNRRRARAPPCPNRRRRYDPRPLQRSPRSWSSISTTISPRAR